MGCRHACICTGFCPGCRNYEPEQYCGEAEDLFDQSRGYDSYEQEIEENRQKHDESNIFKQILI
jgi:hypothetical protein